MKVVFACTASKNLQLLNTISVPKTVLVSYHYLKSAGGVEMFRDLKNQAAPDESKKSTRRS